MSVTFVLVMACAIVQEAPHEVLGTLLFVLMGVHVALNRRWFVALGRGSYGPVRALQTISIVGLLACMVGQVLSALVLSRHVFAFLPTLPGTAIARRAHMLCSYWSFVFAFAHAGLQLKTVMARMRAARAGRRDDGGVKGGDSRPVTGSRPAASSARLVTRVVLLVISCYGAWSFVRLGMPGYLLGRVEFATVDFEAPLALSVARYASVAVLVAALFHVLRSALEPHGRAATGT